MANDDESDLMKAWRKGLISPADLRPRLSPDGEPYVEWVETCSARAKRVAGLPSQKFMAIPFALFFVASIALAVFGVPWASGFAAALAFDVAWDLWIGRYR